MGRHPDDKELFSIVFPGRSGFSIRWALDGSWFITDKGFGTYHELIALMYLKGERPFRAIQFGVGPLMLAFYWIVE